MYRDVVMEEEGPEMREQLRQERTLWVTDQIAQDKFPEDLEPFYLLKVSLWQTVLLNKYVLCPCHHVTLHA